MKETIQEHEVYHYSIPEKTNEQCRMHGSLDGTWSRTPRLDPRWSNDQRREYREGYKKAVAGRPVRDAFPRESTSHLDRNEGEDGIYRRSNLR